MGEQLVSSAVTVGIAIIGLATVALLVSKQANTAGVIGATGSAFSNSLAVAVSPVTGATGLNAAGTYPTSGYQIP
jgi:hypothetical protein